jgi:hypothetical protein
MLYPACRRQPDVLAVICCCYDFGRQSRQGTGKLPTAHFAASLIPRSFKTRRAFGGGAEEQSGVAT